MICVRAVLWGVVIALILPAYANSSSAWEAETMQGRDLFGHPLHALDHLEIPAGTARVVEMDDGHALELDGLVLVLDLELTDAGIEVEVFAPAPCYPGVAFRVADLRDFELAYVVPAVSGQSDAIQYDPVFNGSNTWQLHTGPAYQTRAEVPTGGLCCASTSRKNEPQSRSEASHLLWWSIFHTRRQQADLACGPTAPPASATSVSQRRAGSTI